MWCFCRRGKCKICLLGRYETSLSNLEHFKLRSSLSNLEPTRILIFSRCLETSPFIPFFLSSNLCKRFIISSSKLSIGCPTKLLKAASLLKLAFDTTKSLARADLFYSFQALVPLFARRFTIE